MATEAWMKGAVPGIADELQPVAHSLLQARAELRALLDGVDDGLLHRAPGKAATAAFHVRHLAGTLDRLFTYARGEMLSDAQFAARRREAEPDDATAAELLAIAAHAIDVAMEQVRTTPPGTLSQPREVGRKKLPSTVRGLLFHAAEHTTRHVGQVATTLRALGHAP